VGAIQVVRIHFCGEKLHSYGVTVKTRGAKYDAAHV